MSDESEKQQAVEINMGPNSLLMIQCPTFLTPEQRASLRDSLSGVLEQPGRKCFVLEGGMTAVVLHRDSEDGDEDGPTYLDGTK